MNSARRIRTVFIGTFLLLPVFANAALAAPFANTLSPTYLTEKSAKLNGAVNPSETTDTYQWFEWGISGRDEIYETARHVMRSATTLINTSESIYGLAPGTLYFYRQVAENSRGKVTGTTVYFTTKSLPTPDTPVVLVETYDATLVAETSATLNGYVSAHENAGASWWFEWGETTTFGNATPVRIPGRYSAPVKTSVTKLAPGTTYYFRIVGENSNRTYGTTKTFVTLGEPRTSGLSVEEQLARSLQIQQMQSQIIALLLDLVAQLKKDLVAQQ
jgi:hypothetical protein